MSAKLELVRRTIAGIPLLTSSIVPKGECWLVRPPERVIFHDAEDREALAELRPGALLVRVYDLDNWHDTDGEASHGG